MADKRPLVLSSGDVRELGSDDLLVAHAGSTSIRVDSSDDNAVLLLDKGASGKTTAINSYKSNSIRWQINLGDATAESGSNAGSDFTIGRFNDAGTLLGTAFSIIRSTGAASFGSGLTTSGGIVSGLGITASSGNITASSGSVAASGNLSAQSGVTVISEQGLSNSGENVSGSVSFRNIISTAPSGAVNILSSQHVPGTVVLWQFQVHSSSAAYSFKHTGRAEAPVAWDVVSDQRMKRDIQPVTNVLERLRSFKLYTFEKVDEPVSLAGPALPTRHLGVLAQEMQVHNPELVTSAFSVEMPDRLAVNYDPIGPLAGAGVVVLLERIEALEARLAQLEAQCTGQSPTEA